MEGVSARDNVDGTITDKVQIDDGGFDRTVAGTYTITYTVSDEAGNTSTATRTITVAEKRTTIEIEGKQYQMEYNPQLRPANADSFPFNLEVVTVFEKAYADWLLEHNNQRFAAYWSIVVILDADKKLVEYRTAETNQMNADGSAVGTTWCSGTPTAQNKAYEHRQGMLANLNIPEGGYVVVFINDGANAEGSPRAFGYDQVVNKSFDALGLQFKFNNVDEDAIFNPAKTYPVIKLSEEKIDNRYIPVVELEKGTKATDAFGEDLLGGVSVYHDRETLTAKVHKITKMVEGVETEITKEQIDGNDTSTIYRIKYRATDNVGNVEEETRIFKFVGEGTEEPDPDAIYVTFNGVASLELIQGYEFNENIGYQSKVHQFTKEQWAVISAVVDAPDYAAGTSKYKMANLALFVTDANGKVVAIRLYQKWVDDPQSGIQLTVDADGNIVFEPSGVFSRNNMEIGVNALIPEGGFVYVLATGTPADDEGWSAAMKLGYKYLLGLEPSLFESASLNDVPFTDWTNPPINPFAADYVITFGSEFVAPDEETLMYVVIGEEKHLVELDKYGWDADGGVGAINTHALAFSKGYLNSLPGYNTPELEDDEGKNYTIKFSILAIIDAEGKVVSIRIHPGHKITWDAENSKIIATEDLFTAETMQKDIVADIPDGGFVILFQNSGAEGNAIRAWGCLHLTGFADVGGYANADTGGVANMTVNPFADGFKILFEREVITPEDPEDPEIPEDEMIKNPNFADDMLHWDTYLGGGAATFTPDGENGIKVEITKVGHAWEPRLTQMGIPFEKGKTYKISFEAKALAPKTINLQVGEILKNDPWFTDFKPDIKITRLIGTEWATYEYEFTMDLENDRGGVLFEFGKVDDDITLTTLWLRNIRAEVVEPEIPEPMYVVIGEEMYLVELDTYAWDADGGVGAINTHALAFSKEYLNSLPGYNTEDTADDEGKNYTIKFSILAIIDAEGKVVSIRIHPGHKITWDAENSKIIATEGLFTAETMQKDIVADIPDGGFVVLFQNSTAPGNAIRAWGCLHLTGFADVGGTGYANADTGGVDNMTVNPFIDGFKILLLKESELAPVYVTFNGEASFELIHGFDFATNIAYAKHGIYQFTKEDWQPIAAIVDADGYDVNSNYKLANVALFVTDADGKVVAVRLYQGWTANQAGIQLTVDADGKIVVDKTDAFNRNNLEIGLNALIPDDGFVYILANGTPAEDEGWSEAMKDGYRYLLGLRPSLFNTAYDLDGNQFTNWANPPVNPFAEGYTVTFGSEYIQPPAFLTINGEASFKLIYGYDFEKNIAYAEHAIYQFTKEEWQPIAAVVDADGYDGNSNYKLANVALFVTDADGKVVAVRLYQGWTANQAGIQLTVDAEGKIVADAANAFNRNNLEVGLNALIPEGGFVYVLATGTPGDDLGWSNAMKFGYKHLLGLTPSLFKTAYIYDVPFAEWNKLPINPFAEGFKVTFGPEFIEPEPEPEPMYVVIGNEKYPVTLDDYRWDLSSGVGALNNYAVAFSKEYLISLPGYTTETTDDDEGRNYTIQYSILAITDAKGKVVQVRIHPGHKITWDAENNKLVATEGLFTAETMQKDLVAAIPDGGFVILFQNSGAEGNAIRAWGCKQLTGFADVGGTGYANATTGGVANMTVNPFAEKFTVLLKKESEIKDYVTINGEASFKLIYGYDFEKNIAYAEHAIYQFTKEEWQPIAAIVDAEGYDANSNYKLANVALFVTDADGKVVAIRLYQGWTANQAGIQLTVDGEGKIVADTANAFNRNNLEIGLNALIPDGGFVYVLDTGTPGDDLGWSEAMKFGYKHLLGLTPSLFKTAYIYDVPFTNWTNPPINPFAAGFKVTFGIEYIEPEPEPEPMYVVIGEEKYPVTLDDYRWDLSSGVGALNNYAVAFSKEYLNSLPGYNTEAADDDEGRKYTIQYSILAIIDAEGKVVSIRIHPGHKITWDADNNKIVATEGLFTAETMQKDIVADIPDGGFVILFQNSGAEGNAIRAWGCKHLTGFADVGGYANADTGGVANMTVNPFTEGFTVLLKKESEIKSYVKISGDTYRVELDNYEWDANGGVGAINTHAIAFSKEYLAALPGYTTADTADDEGRNYTIQYSILAIIDAEGKVVSIRIHPGHKITWDADNNKIVATEGLFTATTMQKDIVADIPDGGFVILFQNSGAEGNAIRAWGCKQLTGFADVGGTGYANDTTGGVANMTVNPFAEGFIIEIIEF